MLILASVRITGYAIAEAIYTRYWYYLKSSRLAIHDMFFPGLLDPEYHLRGGPLCQSHFY